MKHRYFIVALVLAGSTLILHAREITVVIASQSSQKILAVKQSFSETFPEDTIVYIAHATSSCVPAQPVGYDCALQGARNRLQNLPEELQQQADYIVSIENYIEQSAVTQCWYDIGLILVKQSSQEIIVMTSAVFIPEMYVQRAQQMSSEVSECGYSMTVGQAIQHSFLDKHVDPSDWHSEVEFGGVSRQQLLQDALSQRIS